MLMRKFKPLFIVVFLSALPLHASLWPSATALAGSVTQNDISERDAYNEAKALGTVVAWEAFLKNFPSGFRADLARAYIKRLSGSAPRAKPSPATTRSSRTKGPADIALTISADQNTCSSGEPCSYTVIASNRGGEPYTGRLILAVGLTPGAESISGFGPSPWVCRSMGGGAACSRNNASIQPGQSEAIALTFSLPRVSGDLLTSCTQVSWAEAPRVQDVSSVQRSLKNRGFYTGSIDGRLGTGTRNAIRAFQRQNGSATTGEIDIPVLFGLFTKQGPGDINRQNDRACIDITYLGSKISTSSSRKSNSSSSRSYRGESQRCRDSREGCEIGVKEACRNLARWNCSSKSAKRKKKKWKKKRKSRRNREAAACRELGMVLLNGTCQPRTKKARKKAKKLKKLPCPAGMYRNPYGQCQPDETGG